MHHAIPELPADQRPREKLMNLGVGALSDAELIAIFLRTGIKGESAIEMGKRLIMKFGSLSALGRLDPKELAQEKGLGIAKASQLVACFELGARVAKEELKVIALNDPRLVADFLAPILNHRNTETLLVLVTDAKLRLIKYVEVSQGDVNSTTAHPREILKPVIINQGVGFLLAHNHPSGDPAPSRADIALTRRLADAAEIMRLTFHDHLIIGKEAASHESFYSFRISGRLG